MLVSAKFQTSEQGQKNSTGRPQITTIHTSPSKHKGGSMNGYVLEESIYIQQIIKVTKFKINLWMQNNKITWPLINQSYQKEKKEKLYSFYELQIQINLWALNQTNKSK